MSLSTSYDNDTLDHGTLIGDTVVIEKFQFCLLEMAESHGEQMDSIVDEGGLEVEAAGELGEVQTAAHQQLLLHHPGHGGIW